MKLKAHMARGANWPASEYGVNGMHGGSVRPCGTEIPLRAYPASDSATIRLRAKKGTRQTHLDRGVAAMSVSLSVHICHRDVLTLAGGRQQAARPRGSLARCATDAEGTARERRSVNGDPPGRR